MRLALAVFAGYVSSAILIFGTDAIAGEAGVLGEMFSFINLALAFPFAIVGGRVAARIARDQEMSAAIGVSLFTVVVGAFFLWADPGNQPFWYWAALMASLAGGAIYGGYLRLRYLDRTEPRRKKKAHKLVK